PDRSTSARTSTAASLCKVLPGYPATTRLRAQPPRRGSVADSGNGARQAVHRPRRAGARRTRARRAGTCRSSSAETTGLESFEESLRSLEELRHLGGAVAGGAG